VVAWTLRWKWVVIGAAVAMVVATVPVYRRLGSEFMPPLDEGALLFMPTTLPGISVAEAQRLMQVQDKLILQFPEVTRVLGKAGRAETSTDPAPFSMMETIVLLKPKSEWRKVATWHDDWPRWMRPALLRITPDHISTAELVNQMNEALRLPGVSNAWTMPIKNRIDMLTTGVRTPVGIKIYGASLEEIERIGKRIEHVLPAVAGTRSVFSERVAGGYFLDFDLRRDQLARYGLRVDDAQMVVMNAIGGENVTTTVEGRERYPVNVRYLRDYRGDLDRLGRALVPAMNGKMQIPLAQIATLKVTTGPSMLRNENGMLNGYVYVDVDGRDVGGQVALPPGYTLQWSGQYEAMERVRERLIVVLPLTLFLIFLLLYMNTKSTARTVIILLAVPFSAVGAVWLLYLLGYNMSIGVWVGLIALMGVDAETGVFMLLYLDLAFEEARREGRMRNLADLQAAIIHGAVKRIRPKFMTVATMFVGLAPIMWSTGTGADVMKRIAAPMVGGIFTSFLLELVVYPAIYEVWKWRSVKRQLA
jgi:Cu(I)/Ag(I) efflux system membrane protein CusA/SilA